MGLFTQTRFFSPDHKVSGVLRSGPCGGHSRMFTLLSWCQRVTNLKNRCPAERPGLLPDWWLSGDVLSIFKESSSSSSSSWCNLFVYPHIIKLASLSLAILLVSLLPFSLATSLLYYCIYTVPYYIFPYYYIINTFTNRQTNKLLNLNYFLKHTSVFSSKTPTTWCYYPHASRAGWCSSPIFLHTPCRSSRQTGKCFVSSDQRTLLQKAFFSYMTGFQVMAM